MRQMYEYILFDLDGTLTDPGEGITNSVAHALKKWNIEVEDRKSLYPFIGPPLMDSFAKFYGFDREQCKLSVDYYREYFRDRGIFENEVYDGIEELLKRIKEAGKKAILATSKPEEFAKQILVHFNLDSYFYYVAGAAMDETRTKKSEVITYALENAGITEEDKTKVLMVGDREYDIRGAKANGLASMGVLFGYGSQEELEAADPDYIAENVAEMEKVIFERRQY